MSEFDEASPVKPGGSQPSQPPARNGSIDLSEAREYVRKDLERRKAEKPSQVQPRIQEPIDTQVDLQKPTATRRNKEQRTEERPERLPPNSPEAEQGVLGCCLLDPTTCLPQVIQKTNGNPDICYDLRHQTILANLFTMFENNVGVDLITVPQRLKDFDLIDQIGGIPYLSSLLDVVPSAANLPYYLDTVLEKYLAREGIRTCTDFAARLYESEGDISETMDELERDVLLIRRDLVISESSGMKELIPQSIQEIENSWSRSGELSGIATGFVDFDKMTDGLHGGELIVFAARPGMGKTALLCNMADYIAVNLGLAVGIFSLEMTKRSLTTRLLTSRARVNMRNVRDGFMSERDFPKLTSSAGALVKSLIRIDDTPSLSIMSLRARARSMWQQYGIKVFGVDYLQLLTSTTKRAKENRQLEITEISAGLKALSKELDVPIIALCQLNRQVERDKFRKPKLSDLRESGSIEQDADVVGLLYKARGVDDEDDGQEQADGVPINLLIAKQRNGPVGDVALTFLKPYTRFESAARVSNDDVPGE